MHLKGSYWEATIFEPWVWEDTLLGTNIYPFTTFFWVDDFPFLKVVYLVLWRVIFMTSRKNSWKFLQVSQFFGRVISTISSMCSLDLGKMVGLVGKPPPQNAMNFSFRNDSHLRFWISVNSGIPAAWPEAMIEKEVMSAPQMFHWNALEKNQATGGQKNTSPWGVVALLLFFADETDETTQLMI